MQLTREVETAHIASRHAVGDLVALNGHNEFADLVPRGPAPGEWAVLTLLAIGLACVLGYVAGGGL